MFCAVLTPAGCPRSITELTSQSLWTFTYITVVRIRVAPVLTSQLLSTFLTTVQLIYIARVVEG